MASIKSARKVEVLSDIEFEEYNSARVTFHRSTDGAVNFDVRIVNPAHVERAKVRDAINTFLVDIDAGTPESPRAMFETLLAVVKDMDEEARDKYGPDKGEPNKATQTFYLSDEQARALANLMRGSEVEYDSRNTIREALTSSTNSDW